MKRFLLICVIIFCFVVFIGVSFADVPTSYSGDSTDLIVDKVIEKLSKKEESEDAKKRAFCPRTTYTDQSKCLDCHTTPNFKLKETPDFEGLKFPTYTEIVKESGKEIGVFKIDSGIGGGLGDDFADAMRYFQKHGITNIRVDIFSPGGSLFGGLKMGAAMNEWTDKGYIIETRCQGWAASAAFLIFINGTAGHRLVSPHALLMFHELWTFNFLSIETPSSEEEKARVLRLIQDNGSQYVAERSKISKAELDKLVRDNKELWATGKDAIEKFGFADGYIGK